MPKTITIVIRQIDGTVERRELSEGAYVLGRDATCEVKLGSQEISRRHARLQVGKDDFQIEDMGSTSGTYVHGRLLLAPQRLPYGQGFHLGTVSIEVTLPGMAAAPPSAMAPGPVADRYMVGPEIGRGGMGMVCRSEDLKLGREVVMKVMLAQGERAVTSRLRFYQEAEIMARLEHPNIVPVHDLGMDAQKRPFYTMKEVKGQTLQKVLDEIRAGREEIIRKHPLTHLLAIYLKICDGVAFAHSKGVVHRDLKPENIMIGEFGEVLVMDWGLAKDLNAAGIADMHEDSGPRASGEGTGSGLTMDGSIMGTPRYMPPEQAGGKHEEVDERSDVFALGGILYAMLTLRPPIEGSSMSEMLLNIQNGHIRPATGYNEADTSPGNVRVPLPHCPGGRVPAPLSAVAMKAMALRRVDRYPSVPQLAVEVEDYLAGRATSAEQASVATLLWMWFQRKKAVVYPALAALVLVVLVALGFMGKVISSEQKAKVEAAKAHAAESVAERSLSKAQLALAEAAFRNLDVTAMAQSLDACPPELREDAWKYFAAKRDSTLQTLSMPGSGDFTSVQAIPGRSGVFALASQSAGKIVYVDALNNRVLSSFNVSFNVKPGMAFSGDGRKLVAWGRQDGLVVLLDAVTGRQLRQFEVEKDPGQRQQSCSLNQDGSLMSMCVGTYVSDEARLYETETGTVRWSKKGSNSRLLFHPNGQLVILMSLRGRFVAILSLADGRQLFSKNDYVRCAEISPSGKYLALGGRDGTVVLLNPTTGATINSARLHTGDVYDLAWTADDRLITVGGQGRFDEFKPVLRVWDPEGFMPLATMFGFKHSERPASWSFDRSTGLLVTAENPPRVWRVPVGLEQRLYAQKAEQSWSLNFVSDHALLARTGYDLGLYDPARSDASDVAGLAEDGFHRISAAHPATQRFAIGKTHGSPPWEVRLYEYKNNAAAVLKVISCKGRIESMSFDASGDRLLTVHNGGLVHIWSASSGAEVLQLPKPPAGEFTRAVFAGRDRIVAVAEIMRTAMAAEDHLLLYDTGGKLLQRATNHFQVYSLAASPDGSLIAIAGANQGINLYEAASLKPVRAFRAHDDPVTAIAFHPTKPLLGSASMDHSIKLWDYTSGKQTDYFIGPTGNPVALAFSPSGKYLAVDGQDQLTRVWALEGAVPTEKSTPVAAPASISKKRKQKQ